MAKIKIFMIKNSKNIFITLAMGIWNFLKISILAFLDLIFFRNTQMLEKNDNKKFPFFSEIFEK